MQKEKMKKIVPDMEQLMEPLLRALNELGGSGSINEIYEKVVELENFDAEILAVPHNPGKGRQTEFRYQLAWTRTYLKKAGYLKNSSRGVWALTEKARQARQDRKFNSREVINNVRLIYKRSFLRFNDMGAKEPEALTTVMNGLPEDDFAWREKLHHVLTKGIAPDAFERLTQRLLRESGFVHVKVTGRTGDGGIDGKCIARVNGIMSFHIAFQ